jgi:hypothetical protein
MLSDIPHLGLGAALARAASDELAGMHEAFRLVPPLEFIFMGSPGAGAVS